MFADRTKSGFHPIVDGVTILSTQLLKGIVSYDPQEFVVTVLSGTCVSDLISILATQGQYLPFDPLLANRGATIGGTVAANAAGSGRLRFGGIRDFLLGVRFIDGRANCIRGGGQVVKNAAGFDFPKLMVGSQGKLGLIYELTFKVFPRPEAYSTVISRFSKLDQALTYMNQLASSPMDIEALDLIPIEGEVFDLAIRIGGIATAIPNRISRLQQIVPESQILRDQEDEMFWRAASNFEWAHNSESLLKLPMSPRSIPQVEGHFANSQSQIVRRYSVGGNVAWLATEWTSDLQIKCGAIQTFLGQPREVSQSNESGPFGKAIKRAMDPEMKFV